MPGGGPSVLRRSGSRESIQALIRRRVLPCSTESPGQSYAPTFGLVAGLGVGAGVFYYRSLISAHLARGLSPSLLMVHADVRRVMGLAAAREAQELAEYLTGLLQRLANGGAKIGTIPAFASQICAKELAASSPLPSLTFWMSLLMRLCGAGFSVLLSSGHASQWKPNCSAGWRIGPTLSPQERKRLIG